MLRSVLAILPWLGLSALILLSLPESAWQIKQNGFVTIFILGAWRYSWFMTHIGRALIYSKFKYPALRERAMAATEFPSRIFIIIPSFNEEAFISRKVFSALMDEVAQLPALVILVISVGSRDEAEYINTIIELYSDSDNFKTIFQIQENGKRIAMGHALRAVAREYNDITALHGQMDNDIVVFMDGDTEIEPHTIVNTARFFCSERKLGALTTHEEGRIFQSESRLTEPWFMLKFSKRHVMMKSHSLSRKVLTLTGRFSVFRAGAVTSEDFIRHMENDHLSHWLFGNFRFLMGDDKSSWFHLLKNGWEMMYIPDVKIRALESRTESFFKQSRSLMVRWFGNMLRNNGRALALGPEKTGLFIWICILDQRISMWTSLVGPATAIILSMVKSILVLPFYAAWILIVRVVQILLLLPHGHQATIYDVPLQLYDQWFGSVTKIYNLSFLSKQRWGKRGASQAASDHNNCLPLLQNWVPFLRLAFSVLVFVLAVAVINGLARPWMFLTPAVAQAATLQGIFPAEKFGITPNDGKDDAVPLQKLINSLPDGKPATIILPPGILDFRHPVLIQKSNLTIKGQGMQATRIIAKLPRSNHTGRAVLELRGKGPYGKKWSIKSPLNKSQRTLPVGLEFNDKPWIRISAANTPGFLKTLDARRWNKTKPELRQIILPVASAKAGEIRLPMTIGQAFPAGASLQPVAMLEGVSLTDFSIELVIPGESSQQTVGRYQNLFPDYRIDLLKLEYTAHAHISHLALKMAGRHPLHINNSADNLLDHLDIDGAWNKGKKGSGYVRFSRSYRNRLTDSRIRNIRHLTLQWSASGNVLERLDMGVDINFHGGYAHHNLVRCITDHRPASHPWPAVYRTPNDAAWAPPDGPGNLYRACSLLSSG